MILCNEVKKLAAFQELGTDERIADLCRVLILEKCDANHVIFRYPSASFMCLRVIWFTTIIISLRGVLLIWRNLQIHIQLSTALYGTTHNSSALTVCE